VEADLYAKTIEYVPLDWWPQCIEEGLGVDRRRMKAKVKMICVGTRYEVDMTIDLPIMSLGSVRVCCKVNRELKAKLSVDEALKKMKDFFGVQFLDRFRPVASCCLIVWDERRMR